jgi:hypothetical protein
VDGNERGILRIPSEGSEEEETEQQEVEGRTKKKKKKKKKKKSTGEAPPQPVKKSKEALSLDLGDMWTKIMVCMVTRMICRGEKLFLTSIDAIQSRLSGSKFTVRRPPDFILVYFVAIIRYNNNPNFHWLRRKIFFHLRNLRRQRRNQSFVQEDSCQFKPHCQQKKQELRRNLI